MTSTNEHTHMANTITALRAANAELRAALPDHPITEGERIVETATVQPTTRKAKPRRRTTTKKGKDISRTPITVQPQDNDEMSDNIEDVID